jgi:dihydroorotate dehydrogenase (fumarate)
MKPLLATTYLGLDLDNPVVASASPLNAQIDHLRQLEDAGAGAIILPSLFQEQIEAEEAAHDALMGAYADNSPEAQTYFPPSISGPYGLGPDRYLDLVRRSRDAVSIPVIASLNGSSKAGWVEYAELLEQAGALAIELNMYHIPTDLLDSGAQIEARYTAIVTEVCASVAVPVSIKLTPHLSAIGHFALSLIERGAAGLVLFNRLLQPDMDLVKLRLVDSLELSTPAELRLPLLWTAILAGRIKGGSIATATGVTGSDDVLKAILAGADAVMTTSALLRGGVGTVTDLVDGLRRWMEERDFASLDDMRGIMSWQRSKDRSVYTRANYLRILEHYTHS